MRYLMVQGRGFALLLVASCWLVACLPEGGGSNTEGTTSDATVNTTSDATSSLDTTSPDTATASDQDNDGVPDDQDPAPTDKKLCGDSDGDSCDDCSVKGVATPDDDGYDPDYDGMCELALDYNCMNGENAPTDPSRRDACAMMTMINNDRLHFSEESGGARPVRWNEDLWVVAIGHSKDMCDRNFFEHVNPDGEDPSDRAARSGLSYGISENIALNLDVGAAEYAFMNEPTCVGHRSNILDRNATEVGVGYYKCRNASSDWNGYHHVTQNFRASFGEPSLFCQNPAKHCEIPPDPPSTAICRGEAAQLDFCPPPDESIIQDPQWGCVPD